MGEKIKAIINKCKNCRGAKMLSDFTKKNRKKVVVGVGILVVVTLAFVGYLSLKAIVALSFQKIDGVAIVGNSINFSKDKPVFEGKASLGNLVSVYDHVEGVGVSFSKTSSETDLSLSQTDGGFNLMRTGMQLNSIDYMDRAPFDGWQGPGVYYFGESDQLVLPAFIPESNLKGGSNSFPQDIYVYLLDVTTPGGMMGVTKDTTSKITVYSSMSPEAFAPKWVTFLNTQVGLMTKVDIYAKAFVYDGSSYVPQSLPLNGGNSITYDASIGISTIVVSKIDTLIARANVDSDGIWKATFGKDENGADIPGISDKMLEMHPSPFSLVAKDRDNGYVVEIIADYKPVSSNQDSDGDVIVGGIESLLGLSDENNQDFSYSGFTVAPSFILEQSGEVMITDGATPVARLSSGTTVIGGLLDINIQPYGSGGMTDDSSQRGMVSVSPLNFGSNQSVLYVKNVALNADTLCIAPKNITAVEATTVTKEVCQGSWGGLYVGGINQGNLPQNITVGEDFYTIDKQGGHWVISGRGILSVLEIVDPDGDGFDSAIDGCPDVPGAFRGCSTTASVSSYLFSSGKKGNSWSGWESVVATPVSDMGIKIYQCSAIDENAWEVARKNKKQREEYISKVESQCTPVFSGVTDYYGKLDIISGSGAMFITATYTPTDIGDRKSTVEPVLLAAMARIKSDVGANIFYLDVLKYTVDSEHYTEYAPLSPVSLVEGELVVRYPEYVEAKDRKGETLIPLVSIARSGLWTVDSAFEKKKDSKTDLREWTKIDLVDSSTPSASLFKIIRKDKDETVNLKLSVSKLKEDLLADCIGKAKNEGAKIECIRRKSREGDGIIEQTASASVVVGINDWTKSKYRQKDTKHKINLQTIKQKILDLKRTAR